MRFMNYKMEVIKKSLQRVSATDETKTDPKIGRHLLQLIPSTEKKSNTQKRWGPFSYYVRTKGGEGLGKSEQRRTGGGGVLRSERSHFKRLQP